MSHGDVPTGNKKPSEWDSEVTMSQKGTLCDDFLLTMMCLFWPGGHRAMITLIKELELVTDSMV